MSQPAARPVALVTGVGRTVGIGAGIARRLAASGWDIAFSYWTAYDDRMQWGVQSGATDQIVKELSELGATVVPIEADLVDFLCSPNGQWINGQLLKSNGGFA